MTFKIYPWPDSAGWIFLASVAVNVAFLVAAIVRRDPTLALIPAPYLCFVATSFRRAES